MKRFILLLTAAAVYTALNGQAVAFNQHLVTGNHDLIGLSGYPNKPQLIEAGPDNFYWIEATSYNIVSHPMLTEVYNDFANVYFIKYDETGTPLSANYIRGSSSVINAFSYRGGLTVVAGMNENVESEGNEVPINNASYGEFIASYDADCNLKKIIPVWDLDQYQYPYSMVAMDKRNGAIYLAGDAGVPFNLAGYGLIGEDWNQYLYVLRFDRDLVLTGVYVTGFDTSTGEYGDITNLAITPDLSGNVVIHGSYNSDQELVFDDEVLPESGNGHGLFALKLDNNLNKIWVQQGTMNGYGFYSGRKQFKGFAMSNGDMVIAGITNTGYFQLGDVKVDFGAITYYSNMFVYRMDRDGNILWTRQFQNMHEDYGEKATKGTMSDEFRESINWDAIQWNNRVIYLTSIYQSDSMEVAGEVVEKAYPYGIFVLALDMETGEDQWVYSLSSDYNTTIYGFDLDASGNVSLMGRTGESQDFDIIGPVSIKGTNLTFHLGLDFNGNPIWYNNAYMEGLTNSHYGTDLEVLSGGEVFSVLVSSTTDDALTVGGEVLYSQNTYSTWLVAFDADNEIGGVVTDDSGNPVYPGYVKAYKTSRAGAYPAVDSVMLDEGGGYLFNSLYPGNYRLMVLPDRAQYPEGATTYLGGTISWEEAQDIDVMTDTRATFMDIILSEVKVLVTGDGNGVVSGNVSYKEEEGGLKGTMARPVTRTSVILKKKSAKKSALDETIVAYVMTDDLGNYYFINVPDGEYVLIVDIPGLEMLEKHEVTIQGNQIVSDLDYTVSSEGIYTYTGVGIQVPEKTPFRLFPNPGHGLIQIGFPGEGTYFVSVYNSVGQLVETRELSTLSGAATVDLSMIKDGLYMIRIEGEQGSRTMKYLKK